MIDVAAAVGYGRERHGRSAPQPDDPAHLPPAEAHTERNDENAPASWRPLRGATCSLRVDERISRRTDVRFPSDRINEQNFETTGVRNGRTLAILERGEGTIAADLHGWTWGGCSEIEYLWVMKDGRGRGRR